MRVVEYIQFCKDKINFKGNDYLTQYADEIIFNYFIIPESKEGHFADNWGELKTASPNVLSRFDSLPESLQLPLNRDYKNWDIEGYTITILEDHVEIRKSGNTIVSFRDRD